MAVDREGLERARELGFQAAIQGADVDVLGVPLAFLRKIYSRGFEDGGLEVTRQVSVYRNSGGMERPIGGTDPLEISQA